MKSLLMWRITATIVILICLFGFNVFYERSRGPLEGSIAVQQLEDSNVTYAASRSVARGDGQKLVVFGLGFVPLLLIWFTFGYSLYVLKIEELKNKEKEENKQ